MDTSIKYTGLQQPYLDDSSIDETLIDDEKDSSFFTSNIGSTPRSAYARAASFLSTVRWFIDTLLIVTILILLLRQQKSIARLPTSSEHEVGGDFTGVSPHFSTEIKTFKVNQTFAPYNTSEFFQEGVLEAWNELMPHGIGFQWVNDTKRYHDLPHPMYVKTPCYAHTAQLNIYTEFGRTRLYSQHLSRISYIVCTPSYRHTVV